MPEQLVKSLLSIVASLTKLLTLQAVYGTVSKQTAEQLALQASRQHAESQAAAQAAAAQAAKPAQPVDSGDQGFLSSFFIRTNDYQGMLNERKDTARLAFYSREMKKKFS
jgi:hypothetical protein